MCRNSVASFSQQQNQKVIRLIAPQLRSISDNQWAVVDKIEDQIPYNQDGLQTI